MTKKEQGKTQHLLATLIETGAVFIRLDDSNMVIDEFFHGLRICCRDIHVDRDGSGPEGTLVVMQHEEVE